MRGRSDAFFTWVWRINGLVVLVFGLLGVVGASVLVMDLVSPRGRNDERQGPVRVAGSDLAQEDLRLSDFAPIAGSGSLYATLAAPGGYRGWSSDLSSGGFRSARNVLFFDTDTRTARWLFESHEQEIVTATFLKDPPGPGYEWEGGAATEEGQRAIALLLELGPVDPERAREPARTIAIAAPDGRSLTKLVSASEGLIGHHQTAPDTTFVFYTSEGAVRVLELDPLAREVRSDSTLEDRQP